MTATAVAVVWFGGFFLASGRRHDWSGYDRTWVCAGVATTLATLLTRHFPRTCLAGAALVYPLAYSTSGTTLSSQFHVLPVLVVGFIVTCTAAVATRWALSACLLSVTMLAGALPAIAALGSKLSRGDDLAVLAPSKATSLVRDPVGTVFALGATVAVVLLGAAIARARRTAELLAARNAELMALREREAQQVVAAERTRIARELHDVVAHHVSAIVIRAQAAGRVAGQDPGAPLAATEWIANTGQEALTAMRQVVRVLRRDTMAARTPEEGLAVLQSIADRVSEAGLEVRLRMGDPVPALAAHVQLAAVRIVQEALTNILMHARATSAEVQLVPLNEGLLVCVDDDGTVGGPPVSNELPRPRLGGAAGNGLAGMRERAQSCGGWLALSSGPRGGWCVTALLPTGRV